MPVIAKRTPGNRLAWSQFRNQLLIPGRAMKT